MYYLQSRYYDSYIGRFLNADALIGANGDIISNNLFAYCSNGPVVNFDPFGYFKMKVSTAAIIINGLCVLLAVVFSYFASAKLAKIGAKISKTIKKKYESIISKLSYSLADKIDTIIYNLRGTSAGKVKIGIGAKIIAPYIMSLIDLSPGNIIANLIDKYDKGIKGTIYL